jgi:hypothetical protein
MTGSRLHGEIVIGPSDTGPSAGRMPRIAANSQRLSSGGQIGQSASECSENAMRQSGEQKEDMGKALHTSRVLFLRLADKAVISVCSFAR